MDAIRPFFVQAQNREAWVGRKAVATGVAYSLGSKWAQVPSSAHAYSFTDTATGKQLLSKTETPPKAPIGGTNFMRYRERWWWSWQELRSTSGAAAEWCVSLH